jgi:hypothetical protein
MSETILKLVQPTEPTPCDDVLREAIEAGMTEVVVVGYDADGMGYYNASMTDAPTAIYHLQRAIHKLNCIVDKLRDEA